jgi:hypothetical protein
MTEIEELIKKHEGTTPDEIHINHLLYDVLIIKAECLNNKKIWSYADYLEKQLMSLKEGEKVLEL